MKRTLWDALLAISIASLLGWGVWTTCQIFAQEKDQAVNKETSKAIYETVKEVKEDLSKLKDKVDKNQEKVVEMLLDIKKSTKNSK